MNVCLRHGLQIRASGGDEKPFVYLSVNLSVCGKKNINHEGHKVKHKGTPRKKSTPELTITTPAC